MSIEAIAGLTGESTVQKEVTNVNATAQSVVSGGKNIVALSVVNPNAGDKFIKVRDHASSYDPTTDDCTFKFRVAGSDTTVIREVGQSPLPVNNTLFFAAEDGEAIAAGFGGSGGSTALTVELQHEA